MCLSLINNVLFIVNTVTLTITKKEEYNQEKGGWVGVGVMWVCHQQAVDGWLVEEWLPI